MTDELYNEIFAEGEARGKRLERKRCADIALNVHNLQGTPIHLAKVIRAAGLRIATRIERGDEI